MISPLSSSPVLYHCLPLTNLFWQGILGNVVPCDTGQREEGMNLKENKHLTIEPKFENSKRSKECVSYKIKNYIHMTKHICMDKEVGHQIDNYGITEIALPAEPH